MRVRPRLAAACVLGAVLSTVGGCYTYRPIAGAPLPVGQPAALEISDAGREALAPQFGPGLLEVEGKLISADQNSYLMSVDRVTQINAGTSQWSGERVAVPRADVAVVKGRAFDPMRTTLAAAAVAVATVIVVNPGALTGSGSSSGSGHGATGQASNRIPIVP